MIEPLNSQNQFQDLKYEPVQTQGECILLSVLPVRKVTALYVLYIIFSILLLGIPVVFVYWYPRLELFLYYTDSDIKACTHFFILNYDDQITIAERQEETKELHYSLIQEPRPQNKNRLTPLKEEEPQKKVEKLDSENIQIFFVNRYMKYLIVNGVVRASLYHYENHIKHFVKRFFHQKQKNRKSKLEEDEEEKVHGYNQGKVEELRQRYGIGTMQIERPSLGILFLREVVRPLYFFILFSVILWLYEEYWVYSGIIFVTAAVGIIVNLYQTYKLNNKIHGMAYFETSVNILRGSSVVSMSSIDVVPGDIVFLKNQMKMPFDGLIMEGSALMNECALTGQSVPVIKKAESLQSMAEGHFEEKNQLLYEGTTLIQVNNHNTMHIFENFRVEFGIPVFVIRTNFVTMKGQLIRIISFPQQKSNIFYKQSTYFLIFLFALAVISYAILIIKFYDKIEPGDIVVKFLDLITITVPPGLPVSMTFGIIFAIEKMEKKEIYCVSPTKVISGGLIDFMCFDKTGTLTEDHMNFQCLVPSDQGQFKKPIQNEAKEEQNNANNEKIKNIVKENSFIMPALCNMATNHSIVKVEATGENVGDPMEVKLFEFGNYKSISVPEGQKKAKAFGLESIFSFESSWGHTGDVYVRFDFSSELLRMSTIASSSVSSDNEGNQQLFLYCKGSPQAMLKIFQEETVPKNYDQILREYTSQGFRVLAIGHRKVSDPKLNRLELETNLIFDGFEVFENSLKPQTKGAIQELLEAQLPCIMITGDNPLTGSSIAYKCGIADKRKKMFIFDFDTKTKKVICDNFKYEPTPQDMDESLNLQTEIFPDQAPVQIEMNILRNQSGQQANIQSQGMDHIQQDIQQLLQSLNINKGQACLTGSSFNYFFGGVNLSEPMPPNRKKLLQVTTVFSRTKPNDKARIVMAYQSLDKKVSMCGDGANDCGALKQADIGLSLSQAQASISAPFTSKQTNIGSMVELIKECRAGLVTNFSLFDIMCMYSFIQYTSDMILQYMYAYPSDYQFVYWDVLGNFVFFITFGYTQTAQKLTKDKPSYMLLSFTNLLQIIVMLLLQGFGQIAMIYALANIFSEQINYDQTGGEDNNHRRYIDNGNDYALDTPETNIIFLFSNFMYIFTFLAFSFSRPWRKQFYTNIPFMVCFVLVFALSTILVFVPGARFELFELTSLNPFPLLNIYIFFSAITLSVIILVVQKCILEPLSKKLRASYPNNRWL